MPLKAPNIRMRGLRSAIPAGYVVGRPTGSKSGQLIAISSLGLGPGGTGNKGGSAVGPPTLPSIASGDVLGNPTGSTATAQAATLTALLDLVFGNAEGDILQRGSAGWQVLTHGSADNVLISGGASALNSWLGLSALLDTVFGNTEGNILQRGSSAWQVLADGTAGQVLTSGGAGALNSWAAIPAISFPYESTWNGNLGYSPGEVVTYNGSAYLCYAAIAAPPASAQEWTNLAGETISTTNTTDDTATSQAYSNGVALGNSGQTSGKWYFEFDASNLFDNNTGVGVANATNSNRCAGSAIGGIGGGSGVGSGSFVGLQGGARGAVCLDLTNDEFWIVADVTAIGVSSHGYWNGGSTNNPATNTGGVSLGSSLDAAALYPCWLTPSSAGQKAILYTEAASFSISAVPAGFAPWLGAGTPNTSPDQDDAHWLSQGAVNTVDSNFTITAGELSLAKIASGDLLGNSGSSTAEPTATTLTAVIDRALGSTEGDILYRGASAWLVLAPGTAGQMLATGGAAAIPAWTTQFLTSVDSNFTVTTNELLLHTIASGDVLGNSGSSTAEPTAATLTALIDRALGSTQGDILYRNSTVWTVLAPGTSGQMLKTGGASANPSWATPTAYTAGSGLTLTGTVFSETVPLLYGFGSDTSSVEAGGGLQSASYTGYENAAFGVGALAAVTSGVGNAAIGYDAAPALTTGSANMAVGGASLNSATTASQNTAVGNAALYNVTLVAGSDNTAIGYDAGSVLTTGGSNTIIGAGAGAGVLQTGSNNILIGAGTDTPLAGTSNYLNIGGAILGSLTGTINYLGSSTNDSAAAGSIGEYASSVVASGSAVSLTSSVTKTVTSLTLTAGDWDVSGTVAFVPAATTVISQAISAISGTTNSIPVISDTAAVARDGGTVTTGDAVRLPTGTCRISLASGATIYLVASSAFTTSTMTAYGYIRARRAR